jgi:hypothetical protein
MNIVAQLQHTQHAASSAALSRIAGSQIKTTVFARGAFCLIAASRLL